MQAFARNRWKVFRKCNVLNASVSLSLPTSHFKLKNQLNKSQSCLLKQMALSIDGFDKIHTYSNLNRQTHAHIVLTHSCQIVLALYIHLFLFYLFGLIGCVQKSMSHH